MNRKELEKANFIKVYRGYEDVNPSIEFITSLTQEIISTINIHNTQKESYLIGGSRDEIQLSKLWRIEISSEIEAMQHMERMQAVYESQAEGAQRTATRLQEFSDKYKEFKNVAQEKVGAKVL